tara:strand:+ start:347 stop:634 length:288 start_codon:yes stop_codon:yes gene_type:complete
MGKLSRKQALNMLDAETITQESFDKMEAAGQIAKERGETERVIRTGSNTWVTPMFYFKGLNKSKRTKKMLELREKINQLIVDFTVPKSETSQRSK